MIFKVRKPFLGFINILLTMVWFFKFRFRKIYGLTFQLMNFDLIWWSQKNLILAFGVVWCCLVIVQKNSFLKLLLISCCFKCFFELNFSLESTRAWKWINYSSFICFFIWQGGLAIIMSATIIYYGYCDNKRRFGLHAIAFLSVSESLIISFRKAKKK